MNSAENTPQQSEQSYNEVSDDEMQMLDLSEGESEVGPINQDVNMSVIQEEESDMASVYTSVQLEEKKNDLEDYVPQIRTDLMADEEKPQAKGGQTKKFKALRYALQGLENPREPLYQKIFREIEESKLMLGVEYSGVLGVLGQYQGRSPGQLVNMNDHIRIPITNQELKRKFGEQGLAVFPRYNPGIQPNSAIASLAEEVKSRLEPEYFSTTVPRRMRLHTFTEVRSIRPGLDGVVNYPYKTVELPDPKQTQVMSYKPKYFLGPMDTAVQTVVNNIRLATEDLTVGATMVSIAETHFNGNGTPQSTLGRANRVLDVVKAIPRKVAYEETGEIKDFPFKSVFGYVKPDEKPIILDPQLCGNFIDWSKLQSALLKESGVYWNVPQMNLQSGTGPWYSNAIVSNGDVGSATIMANLEYVYYKYLGAQETGGMGAFETDYDYFFMSQFKPKAEVYSIDDYFQKTRNILAQSRPVMTLVNIIQTPVTKSRQNFDIDTLKNFNVQDEPEDPFAICLLGYNPTRGFFEKLIQHMKSMQEGDNFVLFMSDNFFICFVRDNKVHFLSLDGSKMEASHDSSETAYYVKYFLDYYSEVPKGLSDFYQLIARKTMIGCKALYGDMTITIPQLSSGYDGTSDINSIKMGTIVHRMFRSLRDPEYYHSLLTNSFDSDNEQLLEALQMETEAGQLIKEIVYAQRLPTVEECGNAFALMRDMGDFYASGLMYPVFSSMGVIMKEELSQEDVIGTLDRESYVDLDFLGFGVARYDFEDFSSILPVLSWKRLNKALLYTKSFKNIEKQKEREDRNAMSLEVQLSKLQSLMIFGGWQSRERIGDVIRAAFMRASIAGKGTVNKAEIAAALIGDLEDMGVEGTTIQSLSNHAIPMQTTLTILHDEDTAFRFRDLVLKAYHQDRVPLKDLNSLILLPEPLQGSDQIETITLQVGSEVHQEIDAVYKELSESQQKVVKTKTFSVPQSAVSQNEQLLQGQNTIFQRMKDNGNILTLPVTTSQYQVALLRAQQKFIEAAQAKGQILQTVFAAFTTSNILIEEADKVGPKPSLDLLLQAPRLGNERVDINPFMALVMAVTALLRKVKKRDGLVVLPTSAYLQWVQLYESVQSTMWRLIKEMLPDLPTGGSKNYKHFIPRVPPTPFILSVPQIIAEAVACFQMFAPFSLYRGPIKVPVWYRREFQAGDFNFKPSDFERRKASEPYLVPSRKCIVRRYEGRAMVVSVQELPVPIGLKYQMYVSMLSQKSGLPVQMIKTSHSKFLEDSWKRVVGFKVGKQQSYIALQINIDKLVDVPLETTHVTFKKANDAFVSGLKVILQDRDSAHRPKLEELLSLVNRCTRPGNTPRKILTFQREAPPDVIDDYFKNVATLPSKQQLSYSLSFWWPSQYEEAQPYLLQRFTQAVEDPTEAMVFFTQLGVTDPIEQVYLASFVKQAVKPPTRVEWNGLVPPQGSPLEGKTKEYKASLLAKLAGLGEAKTIREKLLVLVNFMESVTGIAAYGSYSLGVRERLQALPQVSRNGDQIFSYGKAHTRNGQFVWTGSKETFLQALPMLPGTPSYARMEMIMHIRGLTDSHFIALFPEAQRMSPLSPENMYTVPQLAAAGLSRVNTNINLNPAGWRELLGAKGYVIDPLVTESSHKKVSGLLNIRISKEPIKNYQWPLFLQDMTHNALGFTHPELDDELGSYIYTTILPDTLDAGKITGMILESMLEVIKEKGFYNPVYQHSLRDMTKMSQLLLDNERGLGKDIPE